MSLVEKYVALIQENDLLHGWSECREALENLIETLPERDLLFPLLTCEAVGGDPDKAMSVTLAWTALHLGVVLLDKVLDRDEIKGFYSYEQVAALSSGPLFAAHHFLNGLDDPVVIQRVARVLFQGFFSCAHGQYLDLMQDRAGLPPEQAIKAYWQMTLLKSGSVYQAGLAAGGATGTDSTVWIGALANYGRAFGVIKQLMDDCSDFVKSTGDFEMTLPILLYKTAQNTSKSLPTDRKALFRHLDKARVPETLAAVVDEWQKRALESLKPLPPSDAKQKLANYVTELVFPPEYFAPAGIQGEFLQSGGFK